ncbi:hypothetical protein BGZ81_009818 [Podila clonocystis]|nr:hypothetical protein BGZ81_009818 [Podila clonocystis]
MSNIPPEILLRIVSDFPVWSPWTLAGRSYTDFTPQTIARLAIVCSQWRAILLPVLWFKYDASSARRIPRSVITKYSHYICELYDPHLRPWQVKLAPEEVAAMKTQSVLALPFAREPVREGIEGLKAVDYTFHQVAPIRFDCTSLTGLHMFHDGDRCAERLLLSNSGLKTLEWGGFSREFGFGASHRERACRVGEKEPPWRILTATTIPVQLHSLESLTLQRWQTTTTTLVGVLSQCPPSLAKLGLIDLRFGDMKSPVCTRFAERLMWNIPTLRQVQELELGFGHPEASEAILYLLRSTSAPRKLTLQIRQLRNRSIIATLCSILELRSKNLNTLRIVQSHDTPRGTAGHLALRLGEWEPLLEAKALLNVQDFRLEIRPRALELDLIETSMGRTLRRLEISFLDVGFLGCYDYVLSQVSNLLRNCRNLQWAKIQMLDRDRRMSKISTRTSPTLVGKVQGAVSLWCCPELSELHLVGFATLNLPVADNQSYGTTNYGPYFIQPLKRQIEALPKLYIATLNYATFWTKTQGYSPKRWTSLM